ncbi:major capsid protein, partial [Staphylococcus aureus]|nr:major capsid protein [Staphylococcus aureus]
DDFGRSPDMKVTASTKWSQSGAKIVEDLRAWYDKYVEVNGEEPGTLLVSQKVARALANAPEFQTKLADGATRPGTL